VADGEQKGEAARECNAAYTRIRVAHMALRRKKYIHTGRQRYMCRQVLHSGAVQGGDTYMRYVADKKAWLGQACSIHAQKGRIVRCAIHGACCRHTAMSQEAAGQL